jgi:hypothetical protein
MQGVVNTNFHLQLMNKHKAVRFTNITTRSFLYDFNQ